MPEPTRRYAKRLSPTDRREQLLDVALTLLVESGYLGLSMHAIARRAEVTRPVLYDLFGNKSELVAALVTREEQRMLGSLAGLTPSSAEPARLLVEVFSAFLQAVQRNPNTWRLVYTPPEGTPDALRAHIADGRAKVRALLEPILLATGRVEDIEVAAHLAQSVAEMSARLVLSDSDRYPPARLTGFVTQLLSAVTEPSGR